MIAIATSECAWGNPGDGLLSAALGARPVAWDAPVDWDAFACVVVRSCWDYHLRPVEFLTWLNGLRVRLVNSRSLIGWNFDKRYLRSLGVAMPETLWLAEGEAAVVEGEWVVKPFVSASAYGTKRIGGGKVTGPAMLQRFVPGIAAGEWSVVFLGGEFSHAVLKRPVAGEFRVQREFGGSVAHLAPPSEVLRFAEEAMTHLPEPSAFARVDVVVEDRPLLMELEVIEPELFLTPAAARRLAECVRALAEAP